MLDETIEKKNNLIEKVTKSKIIMAAIFAVSYLSLEPMLTQLVAIRAFSILYYPYIAIRYFSIVWLLTFFVIFVLKDKSYLKQGIIIPIILLFVCYIIPAFKYACDVDVYLETMIPLLAYYILILFIFRFPDCIKPLVSMISWVYLILVCVNVAFKLNPGLFSMFGIWETESFISTIENLAGFPIVMGLFFNMADSYFSKKKAKLIIYIIIYFISTYIMWTVAQVLGAFVFALYLIPQLRKLFDKISLSTWFFAAIALFVLIVWFWKPMMDIPAVKFIMETVLKKDVTFSGRTNIWAAISEMVAESPIIGHGLMDNPQNLYFDSYWNNHYVHAHNTFLQTLYEGGIVTLLALSGLVIYSSNKIRKIKRTEIAGYIKIIFFMYLINLEMDQFFIYPWRSSLWCMICVLCNIGILVSDNGY